MKHEQQPDTQGNSSDGLSGSLAEGDATTGMSGGALGDLSASDVRRGYGKVGESLANKGPFAPPDEPVGGTINDGFCGRPSGYER